MSVAFWSCGGGSKKGSTVPEKEVNKAEQEIASDTGIPDVTDVGGPSEGKSAAPTARARIKSKKVSKGLNKKFQAILKEFYKAGNEGWTKDKCNDIAGKFMALLKEKGGEKIATFAYDAGVTYVRCGMKDKATDAFKKALSLDKYHPGAQVALLWLRERNVLSHMSQLSKIYNQPGNVGDPDVNYNLALGYYLKYRQTHNMKLFRKLMDHLRRTIASIGPLQNDSAEASRAYARAYTLVFLAYLEAAKQGHANIGFIKIFRGQALPHILPCDGEGAVKDSASRQALAQFHNANALAFLYVGSIGSAFDEFKDALTCHPEDFAANLNIGMMGIRFREPEMAIKSLELVLHKYSNAPEAKEASLALAVAYKVYAMKLYDMSANAFDSKERLKIQLERYKQMKKAINKGIKNLQKIVDGKKIPPEVKAGKMTMKEAKALAEREKRRFERGLKRLDAKLEKIQKQLDMLGDPDSLKTKASEYFRKSRAQYEKVLAKQPSDSRVVFDMAALYYDAADQLGGDKVANYRKARSLFKKYLGMKGVSKSRKKIARKYISDLDSLIHGLEELAKNQQQGQQAPSGSKGSGK